MPRDKLIEVGSEMVLHARDVTDQLAAVAISMRVYQAVLDGIRCFAAIPPRTAPTCPGATIDSLMHDDGATLPIWITSA